MFVVNRYILNHNKIHHNLHVAGSKNLGISTLDIPSSKPFSFRGSSCSVRGVRLWGAL